MMPRLEIVDHSPCVLQISVSARGRRHDYREIFRGKSKRKSIFEPGVPAILALA